MSKPVSATPPLPYPGRGGSLSELAAFDQDIVKALHRYLAEIARRVNDSYQKSGEEHLTGDLDAWGFSLENVGWIQLIGGQITFPVIANPSVDPNTLDDYREGTWTPALAFGGASVGITYGALTAGHYRKIGQLVFVTGSVQLTSKGSSVGAAVITSLPFVSNGVTASGANGIVTIVAAMNMAGVQSINTRTGVSSTSLALRYWPGGAVDTNVMDTHFTNTSSFTFSHTYIASQ